MVHPRKWFIFSALAAMLLVRAAGAAEFEEKRFYVTPFVGVTFFDTERKFSDGRDLRNDIYWGGRAGIRLTRLLWFDAAGGVTSTQDCASCSENLAHVSGNIMISPATLHTFNPFLSLGGGASRYTDAQNVETNSGTFEAAAGLRMRLSPAFGLRFEARNILAVPKEHWDKSHIDDIVVGLGLTYAFGGGGAPAPVAAVVPVDGDRDGDGVPDSRDQCPDTPHGCQVDARGCSIDSDGDGVCDGIDQCPDTPHGCQVDARGCPIDTDGDGVCDGNDRCANTPSGTPVDALGCPVVVEREKQLEMELLNTGMIVLSNVHFDYDKSTIRPDAFAVLDTVGRVLTKWPGLKLEVGGHTDSRGSAAYNHALSHRRAQSVRAYLLAHFKEFDATQLTATGYGEEQPLVPNTTEANMQLNRRVVFKALNREILQQRKP